MTSSLGSTNATTNSTSAQQDAETTEMINQLLWTGMKSSPQTLLFFSAMGLVFVSLLLSSIWTMTVRYYELYNKKDHILLRIAVGCGTVICTVTMGLECAMTYELCQHAATNYSSILRFDFFSGTIVMALNGVFALPAYAFYSWRLWKLNRRNMYLVAFLVILDSPPFVLLTILLVKAFQLPHLTVQTIPAFEAYSSDVMLWTKIAAGTVTFVDGVLCIAMIISLYRSKRQFMSLGDTLFRRFVNLALETMLPPMVCVLIICCSIPSNPAITASWTRMIVYALPPVYFHSLLFSIGSRQSTRQLLDDKLASDGVLKVGGGGSFHSRLGKTSHVSMPIALYTRSDVSEEAGQDESSGSDKLIV